MENPEDIVWDTITDSAKKRFDFDEFAAGYSEFDDGTMAENTLFQTIIGLAQDNEIEDIADELSMQFLLIGLSVDKQEMINFVTERSKDSTLEIKAAYQAIVFYERGAQTPGILVQVRSILKGSPESDND